MTQAGNQRYETPAALPPVVPVFPLPGALLLPRGSMPLNIFEPRYIAMVDAALRTDRVIGIVQPQINGGVNALAGKPPLMDVGCLGRITEWSETGDGRYLLNLVGISRFRVLEELVSPMPYRMCRIDGGPYGIDLTPGAGEAEVDREGLLVAFRAYLEANNMEADWDSVERAGSEALVNALSMMSPYGPGEKQALLEAPDLKTRAATLVAITEISLARAGGDARPPLQ